jgi:hypothetical protein
MSRKSILVALLTVVLMGALVYFYGGSQAPEGQAPLERLTTQNLGEIKAAFNATKDQVRVLLLLSPT